MPGTVSGFTESRPRRNKQKLFAILLVCASTVVALLAAEFLIPLVRPANHYIWPPHLKKVFKPDQNIMPGVAGEKLFVINSQGLRADELTAAHTYRILAIGGSTTECLYLDQSEAWPWLLQKILNENAPHHNVWVGNAGRSGQYSRTHIMALQHLPLKKWRIDAVIVLMGINDLTRRLAHDNLFDPHVLTKPGGTEIVMAETFLGRTAAYPNDPFFKRTEIWQLLREVKRVSEPRKNIQEEVGKNYLTWQRHRQLATEIRPELPDLSSALAEYARNSHKIVDTAQEKSVRVIFMTQPTMWHPDMPKELERYLFLGGIGDFMNVRGNPYYSWQAMHEAMQKYNDTLLETCRQRRVECFDLSSVLEKDTSVFYDDSHFNERGARKVATALAGYILARPPFRAADTSK